MKFTVKTFKASFSATANQWDIKTEKVAFSVTYLKVTGYDTGDRRLGATIQVVKGENITFTLGKDRIILIFTPSHQLFLIGLFLFLKELHIPYRI